MNRKLHLPFGALVLAAFLPLVACKSTETDPVAVDGTEEADEGAVVEIVRPVPDAAEAPDVEETVIAEVPEPKKKFRLFGRKDRMAEETVPEVADAGTEPVVGAADVKVDAPDAEVAEEAEAEAKPKRRSLFGSRKKGDDAEAVEVADAGANTKEKKKFRLFGFGKKKDKDADDADGSADGSADEAIAGVEGSGVPERAVAKAEEREPVVEKLPVPLPSEDSPPVVANFPSEDSPDATLPFPEDAVGAASAGPAARIRPSDSGGGRLPEATVPTSTAVVPSLPKPDNDGFIPLTPEPKLPDEEAILPPGS